MKRLQIGIISSIMVLGMLAVSCNKESSEITQHDAIGTLGINPRVSDCGGFAAGAKTVQPQPTEDELHNDEPQSQPVEHDLCSDERLHWQYDPNSHSVTFLNEDVWLNCCGNHSITITLDEATGNYLIHETDAPGESRCLCLCFFDFSIGLSEMPSESIVVELYRHITDEGPEWLVWQGTLDLSQKTGELVIQKDVGWCE
jgi:hypothetical protein